MLERDAYLAQLHAYAREAAEGRGRLVFVGGEMGIGKTTLVEHFQREHTPANDFTVISCDGLRIHGPLGPLMDMAHTMGPDVVRLLESQAPREQVFRAVEATLAAAPGLTVLVGEDVHWGDEASLDLLYFLGRRIGNLRTLFIATYRDDEIPGDHPLRRVLGDLATSPAVRRITLPHLSLEAVSRLAAGSDLDPVQLHQFTGGNPFLVREIVDSGTAHPITIQDAILARAGRLSAQARKVLEAAAIVGPTIDPDLLADVVEAPIADDVDACLAAGLLRVADNVIQFRHAAVREAIVRTCSPIRRLALHRQAYAALQAHPRLGHDHALLAYHAEEAALGTDAFTHALAAAGEAAQYEAHREAAAQYSRALRHCPPHPAQSRVELLRRCAHECHLTGDIERALALQEEAVRITELLNDGRQLGDSLRVLSRYAWSHGDTTRARALARKALDLLEPYPRSQEFARACSNFSQLCMLAHERADAIAWGTRAMDLASSLGDTDTLIHAMINVGAAQTQYQGDTGTDLLLRARQLAEEHHTPEHAARSLVILAWDACWSGDTDRFSGYVEDGLAYTDAHDLLREHFYLQAIKAQAALAMGRWEQAAQIARDVLRHPTAISSARIVALVALGLSRVRQGDVDGNELDQALDLATPAVEFQRLGPVRAARAEAAWLANDLDAAAAEAHAVIDLARERPHPWFTGAVAMWLWRAGEGWPEIDDALMATPFRLLRAGDWGAAAGDWRQRGNPLEEGRALACSTDEADLREALDIFDRIGARPDAARVANRMRSLGVRHVPRGRRPATRAAWAMLTPRELEVLALLAADATNREIAGRLYLSKRTVEHHVSSILAKLDVATREAAAARAREAGLDLA